MSAAYFLALAVFLAGTDDPARDSRSLGLGPGLGRLFSGGLFDGLFGRLLGRFLGSSLFDDLFSRRFLGLGGRLARRARLFGRGYRLNRRGWRFDRLAGELLLVKGLIDGPWDPGDYLVLQPGEGIGMSYDEGVIQAQPASAG